MLKKLQPLIFFAIIATLFYSCQYDSQFPTDDSFRGEIVSAELLHYYTTSESSDYILNYNPDLSIYPVIYEIEIYKVIYKTVDTEGDETIASGVVIIPVNSTDTFPLCSYQHGTTLAKDEVPSSETDELVLGVVFSVAGYVMSMPDYLGLGEGEGLHPYCHAKTEATASVDLLRAAKKICEDRNVLRNDQLFLFGYSQGGHSTMALTRELQLYHTDEFTITASAPMSGPYDMSGAQTDLVLSDEPYGAPFYLPYLMFAYNEVYKMYDDYSDYLLPPYDEILPPLFDGTHSGWEVDVVMPGVPKEIIKPEILNDFINNPDNPFRIALQENDLIYNWVPSCPMRLYYCEGDELVTYLNSINANEKFATAGATTVSLLSAGASNSHTECAEPCFISARIWFDSLKE
ncbi:MAG: alpha/beta hydrolase family protein [Chitinophagales bacterium]